MFHIYTLLVRLQWIKVSRCPCEEVDSVSELLTIVVLNQHEQILIV